MTTPVFLFVYRTSDIFSALLTNDWYSFIIQHTNINVNTYIGICLLKVPIFSVTLLVTIGDGSKKLPDHSLPTIWKLFPLFSLAIHSTVNGNAAINRGNCLNTKKMHASPE